MKFPKNVTFSQEDWMVACVYKLYFLTNLLFSICRRSCTPSGCPEFRADDHTYVWEEDDGMKAVKISVSEYIEIFNTWTLRQLEDSSRFPPYPAEKFIDVRGSLAIICKCCIRILTHLYCYHIDALEACIRDQLRESSSRRQSAASLTVAASGSSSNPSDIMGFIRGGEAAPAPTSQSDIMGFIRSKDSPVTASEESTAGSEDVMSFILRK